MWFIPAKSLPSCLTLCDPMDCSPPGSSVHGILQARLLEWVAMPSPGDQTQVSCIAAESLPLSHQGSPCNLFRKKRKKESEVAQLCLTVCNPMDRSLPGSSVHGIFQAIVLQWVAICFSRGSSQPRDRTQVCRIIDRRFTV